MDVEAPAHVVPFFSLGMSMGPGSSWVQHSRTRHRNPRYRLEPKSDVGQNRALDSKPD
jgi:hypothetical protein